MRRIRLRELPCSAVFTPPAPPPSYSCILPAVLFSTYVQNPDLFSRHVQDPDVTSRGFANARKTQFYINTVNAYSCTVIELNMLEMYLATRSASPHTQIGLGKLCEWTETEIKQTFWRFTFFPFRLFSVKLTKFPKGCQGRFGCVLCEEAESGSEIHVEHVQLCIHSYIIAFSVHLQKSKTPTC